MPELNSAELDLYVVQRHDGTFKAKNQNRCWQDRWTDEPKRVHVFTALSAARSCVTQHSKGQEPPPKILKLLVAGTRELNEPVRVEKAVITSRIRRLQESLKWKRNRLKPSSWYTLSETEVAKYKDEIKELESQIEVLKKERAEVGDKQPGAKT